MQYKNGKLWLALHLFFQTELLTPIYIVGKQWEYGKVIDDMTLLGRRVCWVHTHQPSYDFNLQIINGLRHFLCWSQYNEHCHMACVSFPDHFQLKYEKLSPVLNKVHISFQWLFLTITSTLNTYQNVSTNVRASQVCQPAIWSIVPSSITNCQESDLCTANLWLNPSQIMWSLGLQSAAGPPLLSLCFAILTLLFWPALSIFPHRYYFIVVLLLIL